jgi:gliding motility-associated-like protein
LFKEIKSRLMKKLLLSSCTILCLLLVHTTHAQFQNGLWTGKQAYNWYFGENAGLNFETSPPTPLLDGQIRRTDSSGIINIAEGTGVMSDVEGNLLFYTDGVTVRNRNHEVMFNGEGLLGDISSVQTGLIVPVPDNPNKYYIFSVDGDDIISPPDSDLGTELVYSEVDMSLDGGLGGVTQNKNIILASFSGEKISAVYHADGKRIWVVHHAGAMDSPDNTFNAYLITSEGINTAPVSSPIGEIIGRNAAQMKISPDGSKIGIINGLTHIGGIAVLQVFDFDSSTGQISNPVTLTPAVSNPDIQVNYGLEFSPNSRFLYATELGFSSPGVLHQFDLDAGDEAAILASDVFLLETSFLSFYSLQAGPDGKIYAVENSENSGFASVINYPNNKGLAAGFERAAISLDGKTAKLSLPGFIQSYFESGILYEGGECPGDAVSFSTIRIPGIESIVWNFGDTASDASNTSTEITPSHRFTARGVYTVTATVTSNGAEQTATTEVTVTAPNAVVPEVVPAICADANGNAVFDLNQLSAGILNGQDTAQFTLNYYASEADVQANTPIATPSSFTTSGQNIFAVVTNTQTGCKTSIQFNLPVNPLPLATAPVLLEKCATPAGTAAFNLTLQDAAILNGQDAANFTVNYFSDADAQTPIATPTSFTSSGQVIYAVVSNNATGCTSAIVSFPIAVTEASLFANALELTGCSPFNLNAIGTQLEEGLDLSFYTSRTDAENDANNIPDPKQYLVSGNEGIVYVLAKNSDGCVDVAELALHQGDCSIPKGISPNGDDLNDSFDLSGFNVAYLGIYNRFGQEVYTRSNYTSEWHGQSTNNNELPTGTYYYMVKRGDGRSETGWVYVNREE